jgi:hypothetical protein
MGVTSTLSNSFSSSRGEFFRRVLCIIILALFSTMVNGQEEPGEIELPEVRHLAAALSDPESRIETLVTLVAVVRLQQRMAVARPLDIEAMALQFQEDRGWLDRLSARYGRLPMRGSLFDPAAWLLLQELDQYEMVPGANASPLGPDQEGLIRQLFERQDERVGATLLPEVLSRMETEATLRWQALLEEAGEKPRLASLLGVLNEEWFDPWRAAEPPAPGAGMVEQSVLEHGAAYLQDLSAATTLAGPPDALRLKRLRYSLHTSLPDLAPEAEVDAGHLLVLAGALSGLYQGRYLPFVESLLWVATEMLVREHTRLTLLEEEPVQAPSRFPPAKIVLERLPGEEEPLQEEPYSSPLPLALSELLPAVSNAFATEFSTVDPRINAGLATVFEVAQHFQAGQQDPDRLRILLSETADVVAQLVLLVPDMSYYFDQPVRQAVAEEIASCINRVSTGAELDEAGFNTCMQNLAGSTGALISTAELAGDPDGPFGTEQLRRELMLNPWQRINFILGYLQDHYSITCEAFPEPLPNPLEWATLVSVIDWFARQSPQHFRTDENEQKILQLQAGGRALLSSLSQRLDCISGAGAGGVNDPLVRGLADYRDALNEMVGGLREAELAFRAERLKPGADIVLNGAPDQRTAWRPELLLIEPCEPRFVCEMTGQLAASPALIGKFPAQYLVADQSGLGAVEICYDNVQWVSRRSERVREDDPHVANYFGRLSFDLIGRFREGDEAVEVFGFNFISPDEYHYLFGANTGEVLDDFCPVEWVGSKIVTPLGNERIVRVVPDRLTYLASARTRPSELFANNWDRNQQWRDSIVAGQGARPHEYESDSAISERVERHLQGLYKAEQAVLYSALFTPAPRTWRRRAASLNDMLAVLDARKAVLSSYINVLYPQFMVDSDHVRASLEGHDALLDESVLRRFRQEGVATSSLHETGLARMEDLNAWWNQQPDTMRRTGNVASSMAHAMARLAELYHDFFVEPPAPEVEPLTFDQLSG